FVVVLGRVHLRPPLPGGRLAALATGRLLLRRRPALGRVAAGARLLAAVCRRLRRVGDLGRALLRHALVPQCFVLTFVLHARSLVRHRSRLPPSVVWEPAARDRSAHRPPPACGSGTGPGIGSGFGAGGTGLGWGSGLGSGTRTRRHLPPGLYPAAGREKRPLALLTRRWTSGCLRAIGAGPARLPRSPVRARRPVRCARR